MSLLMLQRSLRGIFVALLTLVALCAWPATGGAFPSAAPVASKNATVNGLELHYLVAGQGAETVILLHGYTQTAEMWRPIMPALAERFTVIAPDLPGIGKSAIPTDGAGDMTETAVRIHALARSLHIAKARVVGHDIGMMVAYAYAAQFPSETEKLVTMDAFLPGIGDWEATYYDPQKWHFFFTGPTPEALVRGRERTYFDHYWNDFAADKSRSVPPLDRARYTQAYALPGRMRAGWAYFQGFPQTAKEFAALGKNKLTMPVMTISGAKAAGERLGEQMQLVANTVTAVVFEDTGHWLVDEQREKTLAALDGFL